MKRAWWRTAVLAAAVVALGLFVWLKPATTPGEHALSSIAPGTAHVIRIERPGKTALLLEKRGEDWFVTSPLAAPADPLQVERLLALAQATSPVRLAAADLERFDLERPAARLTIDAQRFDFGLVSEISREQYVLTGGAVYTISPRYGAALPATAIAIVSRQLLGRSEVPVRIELPDFSVAKEDGRWALEPAAGEPSQDDLQGWVDEWRNASALNVERHSRGEPVAEVKMRLRDGTALSLGILTREPAVALLRADWQLVYYLSSGAAKRLLAPPAVKN